MNVRPGGTATVTLQNVTTKPGSLFPIFMTYTGSKGAELQVPVLDNTLPGYATLTPQPTPTDTGATDSPSPTPTG